MNEKLDKALEDYAEKFNDGFPTFQMSAESPERIVEIINDCIKNNKDVYDSGYLTLDDDISYQVYESTVKQLCFLIS